MQSELTTEHRWADMAIEQSAPKGHHRDRGLLLIGLFKLGKALLFFALGIGAIHLLHKDLADEVLKLITALKFDQESRFVNLLLEKVDLIDAHRLKQIGFATFAYSALALTEGIGLVLEKVWAEYLTLGLTVSFLPWELYELARHPNMFRLSILVINLAVLWYLVWLLRRKKTEERATVLARQEKGLSI
ncbi:MAG: DUF2127 domain-containing protein [Acidobacteria bacterium]|nr:DUF2127 domain-containing protein [Acidobacteriota bacterium]